MRSIRQRTRRWRAATVMASNLLTALLPGSRPVSRVTAIKVAPIHARGRGPDLRIVPAEATPVLATPALAGGCRRCS
jgi:hypothetical protein